MTRNGVFSIASVAPEAPRATNWVNSERRSGTAMTVHEYLRILRERWLAILVGVLVGLAAAAALYTTQPVTYTSTLSMYVSSQAAVTPQAAYTAAQLSSDRVKSYTGLVDSSRVTKAVIQQLGLPMSPSALAGEITASSTLDSVVIGVSVQDASAQRSADIANAVATDFTQLVAELEKPTVPGAVAPVAIRVVSPATPPGSPSSPGLLSRLLPGLVAGLALGVVLAFLRNSMDNSLKTIEALQDVTEAPNLGFIAYDPKVSRRPLTVQEEPRSARAEAFRYLRTNLQFVDVDEPPRVVLLTSAVPEEGKSTSVANLAISLAAADVRVLVIDADLRRPSLSELFGLDEITGLTSVLSGKVQPEQAVQAWLPGGFDVLTTGPLPPNPSELLASRQMRVVLSALRQRYDMILIDSPPMLPVTDAAAIAPAVDGVILVCRYKRATTQQVARAVAGLNAVSARLLGTLFTMTPRTGPNSRTPYGGYHRGGTGPGMPAVPSIPSNGGYRMLTPPNGRKPVVDDTRTVAPIAGQNGYSDATIAFPKTP